MLIHRYWTGPNQPPAHPLTTDWTDETLPHAMVDWLDELATLVAPEFAVKHRSNMARWWLLREHGGIYIDYDISPETNFGEVPFTAYHDDCVNCGGGKRRCVRMMGFPLGHPAPIAAIAWLDLVNGTLFSVAQLSSVTVSGDGLLARVWVELD